MSLRLPVEQASRLCSFAAYSVELRTAASHAVAFAKADSIHNPHPDPTPRHHPCPEKLSITDTYLACLSAVLSAIGLPTAEALAEEDSPPQRGEGWVLRRSAPGLVSSVLVVVGTAREAGSRLGICEASGKTWLRGRLAGFSYDCMDGFEKTYANICSHPELLLRVPFYDA